MDANDHYQAEHDTQVLMSTVALGTDDPVMKVRHILLVYYTIVRAWQYARQSINQSVSQ